MNDELTEKEQDKEKVEESEKKASGNIIVTNLYLEQFSNGMIGIKRDKDFPPKQSMWINRITKKVRDLAETYQEEKKKLLQKYVEMDNDGEFIKNDDESLRFIDKKAFDKELEDLLDGEQEISLKPYKFDLDKCPDLAPMEADFLEPLILHKED